MESRRLVAQNLKRLRLERRMSQEALALEAEIDRTYVSGIERGIGNPTIDLLDRLAETLGTKTAAFFVPILKTQPMLGLPRGRRSKRKTH